MPDRRSRLHGVPEAASRLKQYPDTLRRRLAAREDTEHVQALIRIVFGVVIAVYLYLVIGPRFDIHVAFAAFELLAWGILAAIVVHPKRSTWRRAFGTCVDVGTTTLVMLAYGEVGAPLYGVYLWVIFGNGFRYGVRSLYASHALSLCGFGAVVVFNPFWHQYPLMTGGFFVLLAVLPAYGAFLLKALEAANRRLQDQAMRDVLTGLYNRRYLMEAFDRELRRARRGSEQLGVMIIDIDHFKQFNDTYGHAAGDEVLRSVAQYMLTAVRREDILCRFGGEEFVIVQTKATPGAIVQRAELLRHEIGHHEIEHFGQRLGPVTLSIGVSILPEHGTTSEDLLHAADTALYRAKHSGRNCVIMAPAPHDADKGAAEAPARLPAGEERR